MTRECNMSWETIRSPDVREGRTSGTKSTLVLVPLSIRVIPSCLRCYLHLGPGSTESPVSHRRVESPETVLVSHKFARRSKETLVRSLCVSLLSLFPFNKGSDHPGRF